VVIDQHRLVSGLPDYCRLTFNHVNDYPIRQFHAHSRGIDNRMSGNALGDFVRIYLKDRSAERAGMLDNCVSIGNRIPSNNDIIDLKVVRDSKYSQYGSKPNAQDKRRKPTGSHQLQAMLTQSGTPVLPATCRLRLSYSAWRSRLLRHTVLDHEYWTFCSS
jgi:hypothetical protein